jgi:hypothetical protein
MLLTAMLVRYFYRVPKGSDARVVDGYKPGIRRALDIRNRAMHVVHEFASREGNIFVGNEPGKTRLT